MRIASRLIAAPTPTAGTADPEAGRKLGQEVPPDARLGAAVRSSDEDAESNGHGLLRAVRSAIDVATSIIPRLVVCFVSCDRTGVHGLFIAV